MPNRYVIQHLPRYAITGDAWDTLQHEITRLCRSPAVAARLNPLEDAAVLEYQRSRIAECVAEELAERDDGSPEMTPDLRGSLDRHGSVAEWCERNKGRT